LGFSGKNRMGIYHDPPFQGDPYLFEVADGPPGNRNWSDVICNGGNRSSLGPPAAEYVKVVLQLAGSCN
jgi:hypothetical protein